MIFIEKKSASLPYIFFCKQQYGSVNTSFNASDVPVEKYAYKIKISYTATGD